MKPACSERQELSNRVVKATKAYGKATKRLQSIKPSELKKACLKADVARVEYELAINWLTSHIEQHGCGDSESPIDHTIENTAR